MPFGDILTWIDPAGGEHSLSRVVDPSFLAVLVGRQRFFMPPVRMTEEIVPEQAGARLRDVQHGVREVDIPLYVAEETTVALRTTLREMMGWFDPTRGAGRLRVQSADGSQRELTARQVGEGLAVIESNELSGTHWQQLILTLRAVDPYWYNRTSTDLSYATGTGPATFFPFFPLKLSSSTVFGTPAIVNGGDVASWPIWTIIGPGSAIVITNLTTGESFSLSSVLLGGESIVVDTRPGMKSVTKNTGANLYGNLGPTSILWSLLAGNNSLQLEMSGSNSNSRINLSYTARYLSA